MKMELFKMYNVEFKNESEYVRRAYEKYDCGLISMFEYATIISEIEEYANLKNQLDGLQNRVREFQQALDKI
jgi:hypothetical protein